MKNKKIVISLVALLLSFNVIGGVTAEATDSNSQVKSGSESREMQNKDGWIMISNQWYYYENNELVKGWLYVNDHWYLLDSTDGHMLKGWQQNKGYWYLLDETYGHMVKGWQKMNGYWYLLDDTYGHMLKGWQQKNGCWYFLDSTYGHMLTGWQQINGISYYLYPESGVMASDTIIDGKYLAPNGSYVSKQQSVVEYGKKFLGVPYIWNGTTPSGFDCSGFVQYVYKHAVGITLSRDTHNQRYNGISVSYSNLQVGDLVFTNNYNHVGIYVGNGQMIHSPQSGEVVKIGPIYGFVEGRRIL